MSSHSQSNSELPSTQKLVKSTLIAIIVAAIILVTTVLPAEFGIDPSGVGDSLKKMGEIKVSLSDEVVNEKSTSNVKVESAKKINETIESIPLNYISQKGEITILLKPNEGRELKVYLKKGDQVKYSWKTDGEVINFSAHTDSDYHHTYSEGSKDMDEGNLKAVYDGRHGWWWRNRTDQIVKINLQVEGNYSDFREDH